jgi:glycosyltransferase involved in cell wall biosynthesis
VVTEEFYRWTAPPRWYVAPVAEPGIEVSVVVPAYRAGATLFRCVQSLLEQRFAGRFEVVVVATADTPQGLPTLPSHPSLKLVTRTPRHPAAAARNLGASVARGRAIAFTDADVIAPPDWLDRLTAAGGEDWCVAGSVANGTPESVPGTVEYLVEFFDLNPARPKPARHGGTGNLLVPRALWEAYGPFPDGMGGCEDTLLTTRLLEDGRFRFAPDATILHLNRKRMRDVLSHQRMKGATHARLAVKLGAPPLYPVANALKVTLGRVVYLYRRVAEWTPAELGRARRLAPFVLAAFAAWGLGLTAEALRLHREAISARAGASAPADAALQSEQ